MQYLKLQEVQYCNKIGLAGLKLYRYLAKQYIPVISAINVIFIKPVMEKCQGCNDTFKKKVGQYPDHANTNRLSRVQGNLPGLQVFYYISLQSESINLAWLRPYWLLKTNPQSWI